ncbi:MAG TPA: HAMP domain-containing sensor histidine kinase [Candidatus Limnocylindrales bacterium]|nr:HAMP domain-containing sensor histidine kinase [Candidatus Limnocylindrales bacterium]
MTDLPDRDARLVRDVRLRLVAWSGGITLLVLLVLGAAIYVAVARTLAASGERQLENRAGQIVDFLRREDRRDPPTGLAFGGGSSGTLAYIVGPDGRLVGPRAGLPAGLPDRGSVAAATGAAKDTRLARIEDTPVRIFSQRLDTNRGTFVVQTVQDRSAEQATLDVLLAVLVGGGVIALLVASGVGAAYAQRALVPIRQSLAGQRVALQRQRQFAADASHELRTPLTVIASSIEHLRRNRGRRVEDVGTALDDIDAEVGHLTAIVNDLLLLARSDSGAIELEQVPVDLGDVAADALRGLSPLAADRGVRLALDPEPAPLTGDPTRLRQLVTILVDNAIRHGPVGTTTSVRVRRDGGGAQLVVEDEGAGISAADAPRIFDRFWRAPGAPPGGTGLGLSIAAWIVERHGGRIAYQRRTPAGSRFVVTLPGTTDAVGAAAPNASAGLAEPERP